MKTPQYWQGEIDCMAGVPHEDGKGADYDAGYRDQRKKINASEAIK